MKYSRLAIGQIFGYFNEERSKSNIFWSENEGPSGEFVTADIFFPIWKKGNFSALPDCHWAHAFPQGFSCAKAQPPTNMDCEDDKEALVPIDCSDVVVKVADGEKCQKYMTDYNGFPIHTCDAIWSCPKKYESDLGNRPNCFVRVHLA